MSPKQQQRLALENLDLSGVAKRLQVKDGFDIQHAETTVDMYRRFLEMVQHNPTEIMVPNEDVDAAWHHHILDTATYTKDCQSLFGQYLHHNPNFYGTDAFFEACDKTQATYEKNFGEGSKFVTKAPSNIQAAQCGGMVKPEEDLSLQPAQCGGMLKPETSLDLKPAQCGGMLKDDTATELKAAQCGGMLQPEADLNLKPAQCGGMLQEDTKPEPTVSADMIQKGIEMALLPPLAPDALFGQYMNEQTLH